MTKRSVLTGFALSGIMLGVLIISLAAQAPPPAGGPPAVGQRGQRGPAGPPAPCGPSATLPADLAKNVAPNSRCFEFRMYTVDPTRDGVGQFKGGINELHQRFREKEVEIFKKNGAEVIGVWQHLGQPITLVYMLAFRDRAHRDAVWAAFNADPEWDALRRKYFVPLKAETFFMSATDYSPMK
jgi:hypothetical protein